MCIIAYKYGEDDRQTIIIKQDNVAYRVINLADSMEKALSSEPRIANTNDVIRLLNTNAVVQLIDEKGACVYVRPADSMTLQAMSKQKGLKRTLRFDAKTPTVSLSWLSLRTQDGNSYPLGGNRSLTSKMKWDLSPQAAYSLVVQGECFNGYINTKIAEEV
jgi:hypothetical protein